MNRTSEQVLEECWVLSAQAGDEKALSCLIRVCQPVLYSHVARLLGDPDASRDVWQDSLLAAVRNLRQLRDPARFRPWLFRIATLKCRDWQRRQYRDRKRFVIEGDLIDQAAGPDDGVEQHESIHEVLRRLPKEQRVLMSLFYLQGFSVADLAEILDIKPGAVKTRLFRARERFIQIWNGEHDE